MSSALLTSIESSSSYRFSTMQSSEPPLLALAAGGVEECSISDSNNDKNVARSSTIEHVEDFDTDFTSSS
eukprot:11870288-Heterocapsa_arctica.AAC.1